MRNNTYGSVICLVVALAFSFQSASGKSGTPVLAVDFDGSQITNCLYVVDAYGFLPVIYPGTSPEYYTGQPIYHGLDKKHGGGMSDLSAATLIFEDQTWGEGCISIQWNGPEVQTGLWDANDELTAVCMFKREDFINGLDKGTIAMTPGFDALRAEIDFQPKDPARLASATLSWVIQDDGKYYISVATNLTASSHGELLLEADATAISWSAYKPEEDLMTIGSNATPKLKNIEMVGFRINAVCAENIPERQYPNFRVNSFSVAAYQSSKYRRR